MATTFLTNSAFKEQAGWVEDISTIPISPGAFVLNRADGLMYYCDAVGWRKISTIPDFDINEFVGVHADAPLLTPAEEDVNNSNIHSYIIDFLSEFGIPTWNGYRFWMGFTPLKWDAIPPLDPSDYENPNIIASNDGQTWVIPAGLTNPIHPAPITETRYNSDTCLYFEDNTLYCFYRDSNNYVQEQHSTDGVTWTDAFIVYDMTANNPGSFEISNQQIIKIDGIYWMYGGNYTIGGTNMRRLPSNSLIGPYDPLQVELCPVDESNAFISLESWRNTIGYWHKTVRKIADGIYIGGIMFGQSRAYSQIWMIQSSDGLNWKMAQRPMVSVVRDDNSAAGPDELWDTFFYIPDLTFYIEDDAIKFNLWYVGTRLNALTQLEPFLGHSILEPNILGLTLSPTLAGENSINDQRLVDVSEAIALSGDYWFGDDFERSDVDVIGVAACGKSYGFKSGDQVGIRDAYCVNTEPAYPGSDLSYFFVNESQPTDYELIVNMICNKTRTINLDQGFRIYFKGSGSTGGGYIVAGNYNTWVLFADFGNRIEKKAFQFYNDATIQEFKIQYYGSTNTLMFWHNGQLQLKHIFTLADFADQTAFDAFLAYDKIQLMFFSDNEDKIKNITVKDLT